MSLYDGVEMDAESADHPGSLFFSTRAAACDKKVSAESDAAISGSEESINSLR